MNSGQRTAVSLLVTAALFTGFVFSVYSSVFSKIEAKFYEPERISVERERLSQSSAFCNDYIQNLLEKTSEYAKKPAVLSYLSQTPTESEVTERVMLSGELFTQLPGLDGFRLLDKNTRNVHYSSYSADIVKQSGTTKIYKNYPDIAQAPGENVFADVSIPETEHIQTYKISYNKSKHFFNILIPVYDNLNLYRGNFVFYFRTLDLERELVKAGLVSVGESVSLFIAEDNKSGGLICGLPKIGTELFEPPVLDSWKSGATGPDRVLDAGEDTSWVVLTDYSSNFLTFSELYKSDYFELPGTARILICVCVCVTLFLIVFLLFSFKTDDMVLIRSRIKKIQFAFIAEYLENKESVDWNQVSRQIESRKEDLFHDVKKSLGRKGRRHENQVDALLNKSWNEILSAIGTRQSFENQIAQNRDSSAELKRMLEEVLSNSELKVKTIAAPQSVPVQKTEIVEEAEAVEELDDVEEAEAVEELDDVEEAEVVEELDDVEEAEAVEELSDVEEAEPVEELDDVEEAEAVEELDDVEEVETVEELSDVEEAETVEELSDVEEAEAVEELSDVEEAEAVEELDDVEEVETVEELSDVEEAEAVEELSDVEEAEAVEELDDVEETEAVEELDDVEEAEAVEELDDVEEAEAVEELSDVEEAEPVEELDDVEEAEAVEELDDVEETEAVEELSDVEEAETEKEKVVELLDDEAEETTQISINETNELLEEPEEVDELEDVETVENLGENLEVEPVEEIEEVATEEFVPVENTDTPSFSDANSAFSSDDDLFATVDNVFAEELGLGEDYIKEIVYSEDFKTESAISFNIETPDFGEAEELIPVVENKYYTMASFGANTNNVTELESDSDAIVQKNGIFSISQNLETNALKLDKDFKKLVDAVLK